MKFFQSRALAIAVVILTAAMLIGTVVLTSLYFANIELIRTPSMFLEGEYSIDGGDFIPFDPDEPIYKPFHTITFKGTFPEETLKYYNELSISTKNLWYTWKLADGTVLFEHQFITLDDFLEDFFDVGEENEYSEEEKQEYRNSIIRHSPLEYNMADTPGYTAYAFPIDAEEYADIGIDSDTEMIFEFVNPYEYMPRTFNELTKFTLSYGSGSVFGIGNYYRMFRNELPGIALFIIVCLFGLFFFPIAGFIFWEIDYKYLTFGLMCFFCGLYMLTQTLSSYLPMWITDMALCPLIDRMSGYLFIITLIIYFRANLSHPASRAAAGLMAAGFALITAASAVLHLTTVCDVIRTGVYVNIIIAVDSVIMIFLLNKELRSAGKQDLRHIILFIVSWVPLAVTLIIDIIDIFVGINGSDFTMYGLAVTIAAQTVRLVFDLRQQYRDAIRYQQIQKELYEAKVAVMTSQIQPHFMYNALTSIAMMCTIDPPTAQEATVTFAKYLRGNMDSLKQTKPVPFERELDHLKKYLYIEKLRF